MIFEQPSTRTRVSFDVAMRQLGGETLLISAGDMQLGRGETIADTARVLSRYVDAIMMRAKSARDVMELAQHATVPVINGLTNKSHPCQIMADVLTLEEQWGRSTSKTWPGSAMATMLRLHWFTRSTGLAASCAWPTPKLAFTEPGPAEWARTKGADITVTSSAEEAVAGATCMVTDAWVSMHDTDAANRHNLLQALSGQCAR